MLDREALVQLLAKAIQKAAKEDGADSPVDFGDAEILARTVLAAQGEASSVPSGVIRGLEWIRDYPTEADGRRDDDGYPLEVVYDEYAYRRIVDTYRESASNILKGIGINLPAIDAKSPLQADLDHCERVSTLNTPANFKNWDIESTADRIARSLAAIKGGRLHGDTYNAAKAGALEALKTAVAALETAASKG